MKRGRWGRGGAGSPLPQRLVCATAAAMQRTYTILVARLFCYSEGRVDITTIT